MTMYNIWEVQLSTEDDPATDANEFQLFKVEVEDTEAAGCALFDEDEDEEDD